MEIPFVWRSLKKRKRARINTFKEENEDKKKMTTMNNKKEKINPYPNEAPHIFALIQRRQSHSGAEGIPGDVHLSWVHTP